MAPAGLWYIGSMACVTGEYYHIVNRGVDERKIFTSSRDFERFKRCLLLFNTTELTQLREASDNLFLEKLRTGKITRLVDIIAYCLLDNHFHLFVRQKIERGVEQFLRKLLGGYTRYFNLVHDRKGVLLQSSSKIILVNHEAHFEHISRYIILNSLDKIDREWREHGVRDILKIKKELIRYPHSSFHGIVSRGLDPILSDDLIDEIIDRKKFLDDLLSWSSDDYQSASPLLVEA